MKKYFRHALAVVFALGIFLSSTVVISAAQPSTVEPVQPMYIGVSSLYANLSISQSGLASCLATVQSDGNYDVTVVIELQQDGITIKSWTAEANKGLNNIPKSHYVASNHDYQVIVTATVKTGSIVHRVYDAESLVVRYD